MKGLTLIIALIGSLISESPSHSQEPLNIFGFIPVPKPEFVSFPKTSRYRSYLPEAVDLSSRFPTPGEQGGLNSCTGWAVGYAARSYYAVTAEGRYRNSARDIPSPSYIYHSIRDPKNCQSGSTLPAALNLLQVGSFSLAKRPYSTACWRPTIAESSKATDFRIENWLAVDPTRIGDIKGQVARGHPVVFGMVVGESFILQRGDKTYSEIEQRFGAHAMTVVGYDDRRQALKVINSWGTGWGKSGFGWIAYDKFTRDAPEAYVMRMPDRTPAPHPRPLIVVPEPVPEETADVAPAPESEDGPEPPTPTADVVVGPVPLPRVEPVTDDDCSMLKQRREGDHIRITGFVASEAALERVRKHFPEPTHQLDVEVHPWPQCELLITLNNRLDAADAPQIEIKGGSRSLKKGDALTIEVLTPRRPAFIYISYVQADGSVVNLHQPPGPVQSPTKSATSFVFGDGQDGRPRFTVSAPFGREMVVVLASASPLFDEPLPDQQVEREYLSALRKALIYKADLTLPDRDVSAAFVGIETQER